MMVYATKKQGESNDRLMSRFRNICNRRRHVKKAKQEKHHAKKPTKRFLRQKAVMREAHRARRAKEKFYS